MDASSGSGGDAYSLGRLELSSVAFKLLKEAQSFAQADVAGRTTEQDSVEIHTRFVEEVETEGNFKNDSFNVCTKACS